MSRSLEALSPRFSVKAEDHAGEPDALLGVGRHVLVVADIEISRPAEANDAVDAVGPCPFHPIHIIDADDVAPFGRARESRLSEREAVPRPACLKTVFAAAGQGGPFFRRAFALRKHGRQQRRGIGDRIERLRERSAIKEPCRGQRKNGDAHISAMRARAAQNVTTVRIDSPACIRSKARLMSESGSVWVMRSSILILPSMYQSTMRGTSVRPLAPPKAVPFHTRPVTN